MYGDSAHPPAPSHDHTMPRLSLQSKAFLALTILLAVMMLLFVGFSRIGLQRGLGPYVAEIELARMDWLVYRLQNVYEYRRSWNRIINNPELWRDVRRPLNDIPATHRDTANDNNPFFTGPLPPLPVASAPGFPIAPISRPNDGLSNRLGLLDAQHKHIAGSAPQPGHASTEIKDRRGELIGYLVMNPPVGFDRQSDRAFLTKQLGFVLGTAAAGLLLALLLSWWLAHRWLRPIGALVTGARNIAAGRLSTRIPERSDSEEFTRLIHTFNDMAEQLDCMETSRRQWIGDMAHELRTPLAAMRAEIEAVQDGVRQFDANTAERLHNQLMRVTQLVGDLRASADSSSLAPALKAPMQPMEQLHEAMDTLQARFEQAGVRISLQEPPEWAQGHSAPRVFGNDEQLHRVFLNLLENSLRYTDRHGHLRITASVSRDKSGARLHILFDDTAPGVSTQDLPHLFERLFRTESSRQRRSGDLGGSGLGLAICRSIVQAHEGSIEASHSPLGGLRITLTLPLAGDVKA